MTGSGESDDRADLAEPSAEELAIARELVRSARARGVAMTGPRTLRAELGVEHGTIQRVAQQLGYGTESVRSWVRQADIDEGPRARSQDR